MERVPVERVELGRDLFQIQKRQRTLREKCVEGQTDATWKGSLWHTDGGGSADYIINIVGAPGIVFSVRYEQGSPSWVFTIAVIVLVDCVESYNVLR